jgi:FMN reductase
VAKHLVVTIAGSPAERSRSSELLREAERLLGKQGITVRRISVRDLPPQDLVHGRHDSEAIKEAGRLLEGASGIVVATPIYKAALSGVLKSFLDLLGQNAFRGKAVLPLAVGGSAAHLLAIDYSLKPVLGVLGATHLLGTIYAVDSQIRIDTNAAEGDIVDLDADVALRLSHGIRQLADASRPPREPSRAGIAARAMAQLRRAPAPSLEG